MGREITTAEAIAHQMKSYESEHVQVVAEQNLEKLEGSGHLKYVRGSAGFAGFAAGSFSREEIEHISENMERLIGKRWKEWGSEQVMSNLMVANSEEATILPYPRYCNFMPQTRHEECCFLHFVGTYRFKKGIYARKVTSIVSKLWTEQR